MEAEAPGRPSVRFDAEGGAAAAFRHLVELGHRRIGHLAATFDAPTFHLREAARRTVLTEAGLDPDTQPRALTAIAIDDARDAAGPLLDERPTAVFCDDDLIAAGLYLATRERGLRIPDDVSVIGFDDMDFARVLEPPLTTVALDAEQLGASAFELLERRMAGPAHPPAAGAARRAARARLDGSAADYLMPTTIESGPTRCSTRLSRKPASCIHSTAVGAGVVEAAGRLDQHVEAHQQAEGVVAALVVDDRVVDDQRAAVGQRVMSLLEQHPLLVEIPVVEDVTHHEHVRLRQRPARRSRRR